jgi:uncharacterized coiled-coil protein SlyX
MSPGDWVEVVGGILVAIGAIGGAWVTARAGSRAADTTRDVGLATVQVTREGAFIAQLQERLTAVETDALACAQRVDDMRRVVYSLQDRNVILERAELRYRELIGRLRDFVRQLLAAWPRDATPPPPPPRVPVGLLEDADRDAVK